MFAQMAEARSGSICSMSKCGRMCSLRKSAIYRQVTHQFGSATKTLERCRTWLASAALLTLGFSVSPTEDFSSSLRASSCAESSSVDTRRASKFVPGGNGGSFRRTTEHPVSNAFAQPSRVVRRSTSGLYGVVDETRESLMHVSAHAPVLQGSRARNLDAQGGKDTAAGRQVSHSLRLVLVSTYRVAGNMRVREVA